MGILDASVFHITEEEFYIYMIQTEEICEQPQKSRFAKVAALAGTALALPLAAHASIISGTPDVTITSDSGSGDQSYTLNVGGTDQFTFTASFTNNNDTVNPILLGGSYIGMAGDIFQPPLVANPLQPPSVVDGSSTFTTLSGSLQSSKKLKKEKMAGPWPTDGSFAYLGVTFDIGGVSKYGWVEVSATTPFDLETPSSDAVLKSASVDPLGSVSTITVEQWAYQDDGSGIVVGDLGSTTVPEPSSLALFALGAAGIAAVRARRKA